MKSSYTQLLVHLDAAPQAGVRLALARRLAQQQGSRLTALYATTPSLVQVPYAGGVGPEFAAQLARLDIERRARARALFQTALQDGGGAAQWAELCEPPVIGSFTGQALFADLLLLGQPQAGDLADLPDDFPQAVMAASGKPAIVVPYVATARPLGESIAIAWKPTRESARAVAAAVPLLQRARAVHVLTWGETAQAPAPGLLDLAGYLRAHGVDAVWQHGGAEPDDIGELLLSRSFDLGADLLVMGCYGHSRAREWVLGGASRTILRSMTLPVLMSH